ncbi:gamma-tubulin complex, DGRIP91/SPC98 component protein [Pluteus cervinus]|uniref:Gamma-tubulin complex, DGRIP91/SPC98 component protein n=1 Tax=Pluteus cervinus TaxID=181527 RepID=A0ACD3AM14_9AGAR|nr:gamma-tubulin complex, DGRIP91/SPC98 component protein [Pluteus cervinus]
MFYDLPPLSPVEDDIENLLKHPFVPDIYSKFFVPKLVEKPQDPILEALKLASTNKSQWARKGKARVTISQDAPEEIHIPRNPPLADIWTAATRERGPESQVLSWDDLRPSYKPTLSTGFLSEQDDLVFAAARQIVQTRVQIPGTEVVYVTQAELLAAFRMTVLGTSSLFHVWDAKQERFVQNGAKEGKAVCLLIDGKDEVASNSVISRFLSIGTLMRRLEILSNSLRKRPPTEGPSVYAFAHALSVIRAYLLNALSRLQSPTILKPITSSSLTQVWVEHALYEEILVAISDLYGRGIDVSPRDYADLDTTAIPLLDRIYSHLNQHIERQSPRIILALFAFTLTITSQGYLQQVSRSVAYGGDPIRKTSRVVGEKPDPYAIKVNEETASTAESDEFPDFFPSELVDVLPPARKSLSLLRAAQPDHPLLKSSPNHPPITWYWTEAQIQSAWTYQIYPSTNIQIQPGGDSSERYKPEILDFQVFDQEPGSHLTTSVVQSSTALVLEEFIATFPNGLPSITPTLPHLTSLILSRLVHHASSLSNALLSLLLQSTGTLNIRAHLELLRSYFLLTSQSFKSHKLDFDEKPTNVLVAQKKTQAFEHGPWAVGLSTPLLHRESWPPADSELTYLLRTVIVDSLEKGDFLGRGKAVPKVLEEAEYRLGFATRPNTELWNDPFVMEAMDFLLMDYKPPPPIDELITSDEMSKYSRIFAFLLRLTRIEHAVQVLYRMTRDIQNPLFPTLNASRKRLHHFRFISHQLVSSLSRYISDTVVAGNFDPFLERLSIKAPALLHDGRPSGFADVFEVARDHSAMLDDILAACLLRSSQKKTREILHVTLKHILEFTIVMGELYRGRIKENEAALRMDELYHAVRSQMRKLVQTLKSQVDRIGSSSYEIRSIPDNRIRQPVGGYEAMHYFLVRLDVSDWWADSRTSNL